MVLFTFPVLVLTLLTIVLIANFGFGFAVAVTVAVLPLLVIVLVDVDVEVKVFVIAEIRVGDRQKDVSSGLYPAQRLWGARQVAEHFANLSNVVDVVDVNVDCDGLNGMGKGTLEVVVVLIVDIEDGGMGEEIVVVVDEEESVIIKDGGIGIDEVKVEVSGIVKVITVGMDGLLLTGFGKLEGGDMTDDCCWDVMTDGKVVEELVGGDDGDEGDVDTEIIVGVAMGGSDGSEIGLRKTAFVRNFLDTSGRRDME